MVYLGSLNFDLLMKFFEHSYACCIVIVEPVILKVTFDSACSINNMVN